MRYWLGGGGGEGGFDYPYPIKIRELQSMFQPYMESKKESTHVVGLDAICSELSRGLHAMFRILEQWDTKLQSLIRSVAEESLRVGVGWGAPEINYALGELCVFLQMDRFDVVQQMRQVDTRRYEISDNEISAMCAEYMMFE